MAKRKPPSTDTIREHARRSILTLLDDLVAIAHDTNKGARDRIAAAGKVIAVAMSGQEITTNSQADKLKDFLTAKPKPDDVSDEPTEQPEIEIAQAGEGLI